SSTRAQTNWTGAISSDWFTPGNWTFGVPSAFFPATIDTVTPRATVLGAAGASSSTITVGNSDTGALTIANGDTLSIGGIPTGISAVIGSAAGSQGTVMVTGAGSTWTINGGLTVGSSGTGTLTVANGGTVSSSSGSVGSFAGSQGTVTVT